MLSKEELIKLKEVAIKKTINILADIGIKYRRSDFKNEITATMSGDVFVYCRFDDSSNPKKGKWIKKNKEKFYNYFNVRVLDSAIQFFYTKKELEIEEASANGEAADEKKIEEVMKKIEKLLALSKSDNEHEAISASLHAQKLLAKYNLSLQDVAGEEKDEEIVECRADVEKGNRWKYNLAEVVARNYCCKVYYTGSDTVVFRSYKDKTLIARRVYMYLYNVCKRLGRQYEKEKRLEYGTAKGIYNSFCLGFVSGVSKVLDRNCTALQLVVPNKVVEDFKQFCERESVTEKSLSAIAGRDFDIEAHEQGLEEGCRAMNGTMIDRNGYNLE